MIVPNEENEWVYQNFRSILSRTSFVQRDNSDSETKNNSNKSWECIEQIENLICRSAEGFDFPWKTFQIFLVLLIVFPGIKERISKATEKSKEALASSVKEMENLVELEKQLDYVEQQLKEIDPIQYRKVIDHYKSQFDELNQRVNETAHFIYNMTKLVSIISTRQ